LRQVDELTASGALPPDQAASARGRLEQELVSLVMQSGDSASAAPATAPATPAAAAEAAAKPSRRLIAGVAAVVLVVAAAGYAVYGTPGAWRGVPVAQSEATLATATRWAGRARWSASSSSAWENPTTPTAGRCSAAATALPLSESAASARIDTTAGCAGLPTGRCHGMAVGQVAGSRRN
jgi:hypothetical protein